MGYQTSVKHTNSIHFGSVKIEAGATEGTLVDLGLAANTEFNEEYDNIYLISDNGPKILKGRKNHVANVKFDMIELYMDNIASLRGGADTKTPVAASPVTVTDELHTLTGVNSARLLNKNGANTIVTSITVKDSADGSCILNTDYVISVDPAGYTTIARVSGSTTITTGEQVKVSYTYTPNASVTLSTGGLQTITPQLVRLTNTDVNGKVFQITVYKATNQKGITLKFPADDSDKNLVLPFELKGEIDSTRTAGDQLFKILDEQGVL
jgi:hypothetical protein